jgi:serine/threonine protein kinase
MHRDLKPENVLVTEFDQAKISDFGESRTLQKGDEGNLTQVGTPYVRQRRGLEGARAKGASRRKYTAAEAGKRRGCPICGRRPPEARREREEGIRGQATRLSRHLRPETPRPPPPRPD